MARFSRKNNRRMVRRGRRTMRGGVCREDVLKEASLKSCRQIEATMRDDVAKAVENVNFDDLLGVWKAKENWNPKRASQDVTMAIEEVVDHAKKENMLPAVGSADAKTSSEIAAALQRAADELDAKKLGAYSRELRGTISEDEKKEKKREACKKKHDGLTPPDKCDFIEDDEVCNCKFQGRNLSGETEGQAASKLATNRRTCLGKGERAKWDEATGTCTAIAQAGRDNAAALAATAEQEAAKKAKLAGLKNSGVSSEGKAKAKSLIQRMQEKADEQMRQGGVKAFTYGGARTRRRGRGRGRRSSGRRPAGRRGRRSAGRGARRVTRRRRRSAGRR